MQKLTGLFLGAGASYEAGMPLVWELTKELKNWLTPEKLRTLNQGWRTQGGGYPDEVIDSFTSALERPDLHYEALLGYLETQYRRHQPNQEHYHGLYSWLVEMVYHLLYARHIKNLEFFQKTLPWYSGILTLENRNCPLWVFSLNHDLIIESIAAKFDISIYSGFSERKISLPRRNQTGEQIGELFAQTLSEDEINGALHFPNPPKKGIYLLKIHGALDVFAYEDGKNLLKITPNENTVDSLLESLRSVNEEVFYPFPGSPNGRANTINEIAYADKSGEMQFLRRTLLAGAYKFDARQSQVLPHAFLEQFKTNINFLTSLICIGYGFGDLHINAVIREWLELTSDRRLKIVNPGVTEIPAFLLHLAPQIEVISNSATDYFDSIGNITRNQREKLEKRLSVCIRRHGIDQAVQKMNDFFKADLSTKTKELASLLKKSPNLSLEKYLELTSKEKDLNVDDEMNDKLKRLVEFLEGEH
ncbi:hypothetical protein GCM10009108_22240 [Castellaniella ginsengisoli]|jgi:hypothetical protein|uniref:SIR2-like domain-containing protein n=1 Tax=Castellaniella ginsengisoli TaxID=546114 RepID=A0ABP3W9H6_9BURK|nr:hypothetical protein [uncultured Castellaniella sp.]